MMSTAATTASDSETHGDNTVMSIHSLISPAAAVAAPSASHAATPTAASRSAATPGGTARPEAAKSANGTAAAIIAEATESAAQTLKEAAGGDRQAKKLLQSHSHPSLGKHVNIKA